jgi:hypothetical protein
MGAPYADRTLGRDRQGAADIMPVTNVIESLHMQLPPHRSGSDRGS